MIDLTDQACFDFFAFYESFLFFEKEKIK